MLTTQSDRADRAPDEEPAPLHHGDAGDDGDVGAHERHEPADHQRLVAVLVEERAGLVEVLALEDPAVALVERWPDRRGRSRSPRRCRGTPRRSARACAIASSSGLVVDAEHVLVAAGDEQAEREQQGVAGQEREEQPALDEDDRQADPDELAAELARAATPGPSSRSRSRHERMQVGRAVTRNGPAPARRAVTPADASSGTAVDVGDQEPTSGRRTTRCRTGPPRSASVRGRARWPEGEQYDARAARRGRPAQRGRPLPLLDDGGDRRRPRHPAARLPRRDRELAARLQHRHDRAHRQRVPRRRGAHRRQPPVEPPRRDGHRPLPARPSTTRTSPTWRRTSATRRAGRCRCSASTTCPARRTWRR